MNDKEVIIKLAQYKLNHSPHTRKQYKKYIGESYSVNSNTEKIYNFALGTVYISVKMYNVIYTIEMQNESQIKSFLLTEYEDDTLKKTKRSISATPKYKKRSDEYGQYDYRYLFIRYISEDCSIDIDDISINEEKLINFINSVVNGNLNDLYNKMFT